MGDYSDYELDDYDLDSEMSDAESENENMDEYRDEEDIIGDDRNQNINITRTAVPITDREYLSRLVQVRRDKIDIIMKFNNEVYDKADFFRNMKDVDDINPDNMEEDSIPNLSPKVLLALSKIDQVLDNYITQIQDYSIKSDKFKLMEQSGTTQKKKIGVMREGRLFNIVNINILHTLLFDLEIKIKDEISPMGNIISIVDLLTLFREKINTILMLGKASNQLLITQLRDINVKINNYKAKYGDKLDNAIIKNKDSNRFIYSAYTDLERIMEEYQNEFLTATHTRNSKFIFPDKDINEIESKYSKLLDEVDNYIKQTEEESSLNTEGAPTSLEMYRSWFDLMIEAEKQQLYELGKKMNTPFPKQQDYTDANGNFNSKAFADKEFEFYHKLLIFLPTYLTTLSKKEEKDLKKVLKQLGIKHRLSDVGLVAPSRKDFKSDEEYTLALSEFYKKNENKLTLKPPKRKSYRTDEAYNEASMEFYRKYAKYLPGYVHKMNVTSIGDTWELIGNKLFDEVEFIKILKEEVFLRQLLPVVLDEEEMEAQSIVAEKQRIARKYLDRLDLSSLKSCIIDLNYSTTVEKNKEIPLDKMEPEYQRILKKYPTTEFYLDREYYTNNTGMEQTELVTSNRKRKIDREERELGYLKRSDDVLTFTGTNEEVSKAVMDYRKDKALSLLEREELERESLYRSFKRVKASFKTPIEGMKQINKLVNKLRTMENQIGIAKTTSETRKYIGFVPIKHKVTKNKPSIEIRRLRRQIKSLTAEYNEKVDSVILSSNEVETMNFTNGQNSMMNTVQGKVINNVIRDKSRKLLLRDLLVGYGVDYSQRAEHLIRRLEEYTYSVCIKFLEPLMEYSQKIDHIRFVLEHYPFFRKYLFDGKISVYQVVLFEKEIAKYSMIYNQHLGKDVKVSPKLKIMPTSVKARMGTLNIFKSLLRSKTPNHKLYFINVRSKKLEHLCFNLSTSYGEYKLITDIVKKLINNNEINADSKRIIDYSLITNRISTIRESIESKRKESDKEVKDTIKELLKEPQQVLKNEDRLISLVIVLNNLVSLYLVYSRESINNNPRPENLFIKIRHYLFINFSELINLRPNFSNLSIDVSKINNLTDLLSTYDQWYSLHANNIVENIIPEVKRESSAIITEVVESIRNNIHQTDALITTELASGNTTNYQELVQRRMILADKLNEFVMEWKFIVNSHDNTNDNSDFMDIDSMDTSSINTLPLGVRGNKLLTEQMVLSYRRKLIADDYIKQTGDYKNYSVLIGTLDLLDYNQLLHKQKITSDEVYSRLRYGFYVTLKILLKDTKNIISDVEDQTKLIEFWNVYLLRAQEEILAKMNISSTESIGENMDLISGNFPEVYSQSKNLVIENIYSDNIVDGLTKSHNPTQFYSLSVMDAYRELTKKPRVEPFIGNEKVLFNPLTGKFGIKDAGDGYLYDVIRLKTNGQRYPQPFDIENMVTVINPRSGVMTYENRIVKAPGTYPFIYVALPTKTPGKMEHQWIPVTKRNFIRAYKDNFDSCSRFNADHELDPKSNTPIYGFITTDKGERKKIVTGWNPPTYNPITPEEKRNRCVGQRGIGGRSCVYSDTDNTCKVMTFGKKKNNRKVKGTTTKRKNIH